MLNRLFLNRLRKELPRWVDEGWVTAEHQRLILEQVSTQAAGVRRAPLALGVLGVLLIGTGVITFFAANWSLIPKLIKLAVLFGAMWSAYAAAGWMLTRRARLERGFGHAFLLLAVILFGANIMLIAQTYHIQAHFPNGVLLWALGALIAVYLVPTQLVAVAGLVLTGLWSFLEIFENLAHDRVTLHWSFLVVWGLFLPQIYRRGWRHAGTVATLAFILWLLLNLVDLADGTDAVGVDVLQVVLPVSVCLFLIGAIMERSDRLFGFSATVRYQALILGLLSLYGLTLRFVHDLGDGLWPRQAATAPWIVGTLVALAAAGALAVLLHRQVAAAQRQSYLWWGYGLLGAITLIVIANLFRTAGEGYATVVYVLYNCAYLGGLVWLLYAGYQRNDAFQVNVSFLFFGIGLLTLYFDTFWTLMDRSLFFMGGGVLLLAGGYLVERQRRKLLRRLETEVRDGEPP